MRERPPRARRALHAAVRVDPGARSLRRVVAAYSDLEPSMLQAVAHLDDIDAMPGQLRAALGD